MMADKQSVALIMGSSKSAKAAALKLADAGYGVVRTDLQDHFIAWICRRSQHNKLETAM